MSKSKFFEEIKSAVVERECEAVYNKGINLYFPNTSITHPFACDGFLDTKTEAGKLLKLIIEYKFDELLSSKTGRAKVLIQVVFYMKQFELNGLILPNVCMVGDVNECFVIHTNALLKYLDEDVEWSVAPSTAHNVYPDLVLKIANDEEINPFVFNIDENFSFKDVAQKITDLADNVQRYVHVTEHNIATIYDYFCRNVIKNVKKIKSHDLVGIFMGVITNGDEYYQHPTKKNILVTPLGNIDINGDGFKSFFSYFQRNYTPQEKNNLTAIADRLIEDTDRRNNGDFWTPTLFVDYAHKMISEQLGEDWKEKYVVWDNCCYDEETEFFSQDGWKFIKDYKEGDSVLQFNQDGTTKFVKPIRYINHPYYGNWITFKSSQVDIKTTSEHDYVVKSDKRGSNNKWRKMCALDLYNEANRIKNLHKIIPLSFKFDGGLSVDENLLRLAIAINADGCYKPKTTLNNNKNRTSRNTRFTDSDTSVRDCYVVSVKKDRKAERMHLLLKNANIEYKFDEYGAYKNFTFHFPFNPKHFPTDWYNLNNACKKIFIDELFYWDGTIVNYTAPSGRASTRKTYSTSKYDDAKLVQFLFLTSGYGCNFRIDSREGRKDNYLLSITNITETKLSNSTSKFSIEKSSVSDKCYCFEVESGMLVVRRHNKIFISGNCGSKNLTRDYKFKDIYCSTLFDSELKIGERYNKEAISFQFDFLNDDLEKLPKGLIEAFEQNKPIVFFINPPYATASSGGANSKFKENVGRTKINEQMILDNIGSCSQNLYAQFLYRILLIKQQYNLTSCHIALFSPTLFLTGSSWKGFRNKFLNEFSFIDAVQFKASHFADVSDNWGISFSIWNCGIQNDINNFFYKCIDNLDGEIKIVEAKTVYNTDNLTSANKWVNQDAIKIGVHETITAKSALNISDKLKKVGNNIGYFINDTNNIDANAQGVYFMTMPVSRHIGQIEVQINNFDKCTALFAARRLVSCNWINWADEYIAPNEEHEKYQEFVKDSVIYSLFESKSNQSSLRQIEYKGKLWDIKNEFFWMSKEEIMDLANEYNMDEIYEDAKTSDERYVYKYIHEHKEEFSQEALDVLNKAIELTKKSFKYRQLFADEHPEYQLEKCWDAGFYQLKAIWKEYMKDDFEEFKKLYKVLSDKMRPMVYSIGFLK